MARVGVAVPESKRFPSLWLWLPPFQASVSLRTLYVSTCVWQEMISMSWNMNLRSWNQSSRRRARASDNGRPVNLVKKDRSCYRRRPQAQRIWDSFDFRTTRRFLAKGPSSAVHDLNQPSRKPLILPRFEFLSMLHHLVPWSLCASASLSLSCHSSVSASYPECCGFRLNNTVLLAMGAGGHEFDPDLPSRVRTL